VCAIFFRPAWADDPPAPSQPAAPATAVAIPAEPSAIQATPEKDPAINTPQQALTESPSPVIKPLVTVVGAKPDLSPGEKQLIARGYKLEVRQGQRYFCRKEPQIGSRFEVKTCDTAQSIEARRIESQEAVRVIQNDRPTSNH